jgi:microsomal dipeptidase-like Zn-dependent dipeptidase
VPVRRPSRPPRRRRLGAATLATLLSGALVAALGAPAGATAADAPDRYALVHGCYVVRSAQTGQFVRRVGGGYRADAATAGAGTPFRMQATALGRYVLYGPDRAAPEQAGQGVRPATVLGGASDWAVRPDGDGFQLQALTGGQLAVQPDANGTLSATGGAVGTPGRFSFVAADGCATFPEADVNASGTPARGVAPDAEVRGLMDSHNHPINFNFIGGRVHCGRTWSAYGIEQALVDCPDHQLANGNAAVLENFLSDAPTGPVGAHDPVGWPTFKDWPRWNSLTHEGAYWKWMERAWRGGLRVMVVDLVDNGALCRIYPFKGNDCRELHTLLQQARWARELEGYIDAQSGGPGKGWFRIVTSPDQARRVINDGKLAIVLGMENSEVLDCALPGGRSTCTQEQVMKRLDDMYALGVRSAFPVHKFDNPFGGTTGDGGLTGLLTNVGNLVSTGSFLKLQKCDAHSHGDGHVHDRYDLDTVPRLDIVTQLLTTLGVHGVLPVYPSGGLCNPRGLSDLGRKLIERMMDKGMMVEVDHMSVKTRDEALKVIERRRYAGVISSHSWSDETSPARILRLGGFIGPYAGASTSFAAEWRTLRKVAAEVGLPRLGIGFGADINGFGAQGPRREKNSANPVRYPFRSADGAVVLDRNHAGQRTWDINREGVAHYGLYPDWVEDLRQIAGDPIVDDLLHGPEAYLRTWERATGVPAERCQDAGRLTGAGVGPLRMGEERLALLRRVGQPAERPGGAYRYCAKDARGREGRIAAAFDDQGRTVAVSSTLAAHRVSGVRPGNRAAVAARGARRVANGLWVRRAPAAGGRRVVFVTRRGKVRAVAIVRADHAKAARLRTVLRRAGVR